MRNFVAATVAATMFATSAFAATSPGAPLPWGKPAGVTKAQDGPDHTVLYVVAGGFVILGVAWIASSNDNSTLATGTTSTSTSTR